MDAIKKKYYALCQQYHPDINKSDGAQEKMAEINAAYEKIKEMNAQGLSNIFQSPHMQQAETDFNQFNARYRRYTNNFRNQQNQFSEKDMEEFQQKLREHFQQNAKYADYFTSDLERKKLIILRIIMAFRLMKLLAWCVMLYFGFKLFEMLIKSIVKRRDDEIKAKHL